MEKEVKIAYRHPMKSVRENGSRILEWRDANKEQHFFEPEEAGKGRFVYVVPQEYARQLLANQPDRYFLLAPATLMIKVKKGLGSTTKKITAIDWKIIDDKDTAEFKAAQVKASQPVAPEDTFVPAGIIESGANEPVQQPGPPQEF